MEKDLGEALVVPCHRQGMYLNFTNILRGSHVMKVQINI